VTVPGWQVTGGKRKAQTPNSKSQTPDSKLQGPKENEGGERAVVGKLVGWTGKVQHRLFQAGAALSESPA